MTLIQELQKPEYLGLTDEEVLAALPEAEVVLGRLQGANKLDVTTLLAKGSMRKRWSQYIELNKDSTDPQTMAIVDLAEILYEMLEPNLLMQDNYKINLAVPDVYNMLYMAELTGLMTETEANEIKALSTYTIDPFPNTTLEDITKARLSIDPTNITATTGITDTDELDYIINQGAREPHRATVTIDVAVPFDDVITFTALDKGIDETVYGSEPHVRGTIPVKANETGVFKGALNNSGLDRKVRYIATSKFSRAFDVVVVSVTR